jgi:hypothetical protein
VTFGALNALLNPEFDMSMYCYATPKGLRRRLRQSAEVQEAKRALASGLISEETIERFVAWVMRDLERGKKFQHQTALSAIVVILEDRQTRFAESLIKELSEVRAVELSLSAGVATEVANYRKSQALTSSDQVAVLEQYMPWLAGVPPIILPGALNPQMVTSAGLTMNPELVRRIA